MAEPHVVAGAGAPVSGTNLPSAVADLPPTRAVVAPHRRPAPDARMPVLSVPATVVVVPAALAALPAAGTPQSVPDVCGADVGAGVDTDGDAQADTVLVDHADELFVLADLDGDTLADQVLAIGPDGSAQVTGCRAVGGSAIDGWEP